MICSVVPSYSSTLRLSFLVQGIRLVFHNPLGIPRTNRPRTLPQAQWPTSEISEYFDRPVTVGYMYMFSTSYAIKVNFLFKFVIPLHFYNFISNKSLKISKFTLFYH